MRSPWIPVVLALLGLFPVTRAFGAAMAAPSTETTIESNGMRAARTVTTPPGDSHGSAAEEVASSRTSNTYLWVDRNSLFAIAEYVGISGDGAYGVAGWWSNNMRTSLYRIAGDSIPVWNFPMPHATTQIPVDIDRLGDRIVSTAHYESLLVFSGANGNPIHEHGYTPPMVGFRCGVSADGSTYVGTGAVVDNTHGEIRVFDGSGILRFTQPIAPGPDGVSVSADGRYVSVNVSISVRVYDALTGNLRDTIYTQGITPAPAVLSRDGVYLVVGDLTTVRLYRWDGSHYVQLWSHTIPSITSVTALAISEDASTIAAGAWTASPSGGRVVVYDRSSSTPLWTDASYGDWVNSVRVTPDGRRIVAGCWGRQGGTVGNIVSVYDRGSSTPVHSIGDDAIPGVGSCFSVGISGSGRYVIAGGKKVHARDWGDSGWVMAIEVAGAADAAEPIERSRPPRLVAFPNPSSSTMWIGYSSRSAPTAGPLRVVSLEGRAVRTLPSGERGLWEWDGCDTAGRRVPPGVYFMRADGQGGMVGEILRLP